jgi:hypothetical protein
MTDVYFSDPDVRLVVELARGKEASYTAGDAMWVGSPFQWIKSRPSRQIGKIGEELVSEWCENKGFSVQRSTNSDADRVISGHRIEIKFSTLWTDNKIYKFQQIRDQAYDYCFCIGVSPFDVHAWLIPKTELKKDRLPSFGPQHGGSDGIDTKWLSFEAETPPSWLKPFGGTLSQVEELLKKAGSGSF